MRTCITCRWHASLPPRENNPGHYCLHPMNRHAVDGAHRSAYGAREASGCCGPSGDLHSSVTPRGYAEIEQ